VVRECRTADVNTTGMSAMSTAAANQNLFESISTSSQLLSYNPHELLSDGQVRQELVAPSKFTTEIVSYDNTVPSSADFRIGGLGRSRGRKAKFQQHRIRGLYDDPDVMVDDADEIGSTTSARRNGSVVFCPRKDTGSEGGWLCYVVDSADNIRRACALRTVVVSCSVCVASRCHFYSCQDLSTALEGVGCNLTPGIMLEHPCTYVVGNRRQRWALLGI
jgi:hypothetical protein